MQKYANLANWPTEIQPSMQIQSKGSCEINEIRKSEENSEVGGWVMLQVGFFCGNFVCFLYNINPKNEIW